MPKTLRCITLCAFILLSGCRGSYQHTGSGLMVGGATGAMGGALCCGNPIRDTGTGIIVGAAVGALIGYVLDVYWPN